MHWIAILERTLLLAIVWWVLTGAQAASWPLGTLSIALAVMLSVRLRPPAQRQISYARLPAFILFFLFHSLKGGLQVAAMALRPRRDLQPALLEMNLRLPDAAAQALLMCTLNLLPGTLCVSLEGRLLRLHVLDRRLHVEHDIRLAELQVARLLRSAVNGAP